MRIPTAIKKILAELDVLFDAYEKALRLEDYETARIFGNELCVFFSRYRKELNLEEGKLEEMYRLRRNVESKWIAQKLAESRLATSCVDAEKALENYYQILLEQEPRGRSRTGH